MTTYLDTLAVLEYEAGIQKLVTCYDKCLTKWRQPKYRGSLCRNNIGDLTLKDQMSGDLMIVHKKYTSLLYNNENFYKE